MAVGVKEPDALDRWFAMQRRAWFLRWRWLVILIVLLFASRIAWELFSHYVTGFTLDVGWQEARQSLLYQSYHSLRRQFRLVMQYDTYYWWAAAIWLSSSLVIAQLPRGEMILPFPANTVFSRLLKKSRQLFWTTLGISVLTIPLMSEFSSYILWGEFYTFLGSDVFGLIILVCLIIFFTELQIALLIRFPYRLSRLPLYAFPALICFVNLEMARANTDFEFTHLCPGPFRQWQTAAVDIGVAFGHLTGIVIGILIGCWWLRRILKSNNYRQWSIYLTAILIGQFLPVISFIQPNVWVARIVIPLSALLRGINLGNPLLGWTEPHLAAANPYSIDWESLTHHIENLMAVGQDDAIWNLYNNQGLVFSPLFYIPTWAAYCWVAFYFGLSIWVIARGNNAVPDGFTGSWENQPDS